MFVIQAELTPIAMAVITPVVMAVRIEVDIIAMHEQVTIMADIEDSPLAVATPNKKAKLWHHQIVKVWQYLGGHF